MLLRDKIDKNDIESINISIAAYEKMLDFYDRYTEKHGQYDYVDEQVHKLNGIMAEYLVARDMMLNKD